MKTRKRILCFLLSVIMTLGLFSGCQAEPTLTETAKSTDTNQTTLLTHMSDSFKEAVELGIAWEELAVDSEKPIIGSELVKLMSNTLAVLEKPDATTYLDEFTVSHGDSSAIQRYQFAQLLYGVHNDVIAGHSFALSGAAMKYEVGGAYTNIRIWDCPDSEQIKALCDYDDAPCNYAICAYDRITGDKLMELYDDFTFRPTETVTVASAVETILHFARSFEKDPVYTDVADAQASVCTIDPLLYTGETTLPDASNQDLPNWRGCNISHHSMDAWAIGWGADDEFFEGNLDYLKEVGINFVHIYLSWSYFQGPDHTFDNKVNLSRLEQLDDIISWCMERDIHIQLVFNDVPNLDWNNQGFEDLAARWNSCFEDEAVRDSVTAFWRMLAKRYADIPNNYLSFNLMNECDPIDDENYVWGLGDAVAAIWEESPGRVIVADVHTHPGVTGESMAALGCALSYHYYNLPDISLVTAEKEAATPGFYESITGASCLANASIYGPTYWDTSLPEEAKGAMKFSGDVGGATLSVTISGISWFDTIMRISADGQILYEGMEPYIYDEANDAIIVNGTVTVTIPEDATSFEISCPEGSCFDISDISLTLANGKSIPFMIIHDAWHGLQLAAITVHEDGSYDNTLTLANLKQGQDGQSLLDLIAIGEKYGVDVMVGECGFFEGGAPMTAGIRQEAVESLFMDQIKTFEALDLAWCFEYGGRYALVTPAPYLEGIEYRDLENSPLYANLEMDAFFKDILADLK